VAVQAAGLLQKGGHASHDAALRDLARKAGPHVERAFDAFATAWRESQLAQSQ
jgi:hypothetical protein